MRTKSSEKETPFTHLKDAFRWGSTLGFLPGKGPENEIGQFVFSNWHCVKCMFSGSTIFISWLFIYGAMFINGKYFSRFKDFFSNNVNIIRSQGVTLTDISNFLKNEVGFSTTDVISANIFELLWIINTYLPIYVFKKSTAGLNRFIKDVGNISECSPVSSNANKRIAMKNMRIVNMFHGLHFVQNFLTTCYMVSFLMNVSKLRGEPFQLLFLKFNRMHYATFTKPSSKYVELWHLVLCRLNPRFVQGPCEIILLNLT